MGFKYITGSSKLQRECESQLLNQDFPNDKKGLGVPSAHSSDFKAFAI